MVKLLNLSRTAFFEKMNRKQIVFWGAGKRARYISSMYNIQGKVIWCVDNNPEVQGSSIQLNGYETPIIGVNDFVNEIKDDVENYLVIITVVYGALDVIRQLDANDSLTGLECVIGRMLDDYYEPISFSFPKLELSIPKKIHYCWFGGGDIPEGYARCIDTWKEKCPDYQIIRWDESNYDVTKNQYMRQAYEAGKMGFVPDYARLDIVYNEGGIYLDCDLELLNGLDCMLHTGMFCGFTCYGMLNLGLGFGAVKGHRIIKELMDEYNDARFVREDGTLDLTACTWYENPVFERNGFSMNNTFQTIGDITLYPSEVLAPDGASGWANNYTKRTILRNNAMLSWISDSDRHSYQKMQLEIKDRLKKDGIVL